jgi:threonine aldolase
MLRTLPSKNGMMNPDDIKNAIRTSEYYLPKTKMICMENTHNRHCGAVLDYDYLKDIKSIAVENDLTYHLDGARIWNACIASGRKPMDYGALFDTISVCLSKGMGAPVGSVLLGTQKDIEKARKWRKILGGGMRQAGILAAAGIFAIDNNFERLAIDHKNAKLFADLLQNHDGIKVDMDLVQTNMVFIEIDKKINLSEYINKLKDAGIKIGNTGPNTLRAVFHLNINERETIQATDIILNITKGFLN